MGFLGGQVQDPHGVCYLGGLGQAEQHDVMAVVLSREAGVVLQEAQVEARVWEAVADLDKLGCVFVLKQVVATQPQLVIAGESGGAPGNKERGGGKGDGEHGGGSRGGERETRSHHGERVGKVKSYKEKAMSERQKDVTRSKPETKTVRLRKREQKRREGMRGRGKTETERKGDGDRRKGP